jgi:hypothetical protein
MSDEQVIAAKLTVNPDDAVKGMLKAKQAVEEYKKELKNAKAGSEEQVTAFKNLKAAEEDLAKANSKLNAANQETTGHFSKLKEGIGALPGATGAAGKGVDGLGAQFKKLLANPVVLVIALIVAGLVALYKAFTSTDEGAQKVQSVLDGLGAVMRELLQRAAGLANAIVKLFTGDFKGAMEDGKKAVTGFGDAMVDSFKRGKEASDLLDEVADAVRVLDIQYAAMSARIAKSKEILTDETASFKDKTKALKESGDAIEQYYKKKAENDSNELTAIAKKYNIEAKLNELRKKGFEEGAAEFDNYLQTLAIGEDGINKIEDSIKKSIASGQEYSANQRQQNKAEAALERQHAAELKAAADKAAAEAKARRQQLVEFTNKLTKLQQENELSLIKDGYEKELKALENKTADEKRQNQLAFQDKKITKEQLNKLNEALDIQANLQRDAINDKHNKEIATKEEAFQKNIEALKIKIRLSSITDSRELEKVQLQLSYEEQLKTAIVAYKGNQEQFQAAKKLIDEQHRIDQQKLDDKNAAEDAKKKLDAELTRLAGIAADPESSFDARREAIDAEIKANQELYDKKLITIEQFTAKDKEFKKARVALGKEEVQSYLDNAGKIGGLLENLSGLVGKQTAAGKAFSAANATIQAIQSAVSSYNAMASIPIVGPALGVVAAAAALAAGYANVKKILAVKIPGQGDGAAPNLGGGVVPAAPIAPQTTATKLDQDSINAVGNAAAGGVNAVRAYVVEQDSAAAVARAARLSGAAVLGG